MDHNEAINLIIRYIRQVQQGTTGYHEIYKNALPVNFRHEFLFFIKPEITLSNPTIDLEAILNMLFAKIEAFNLSIKDVRILEASYLEKYHIIAQHYGVINALSRSPCVYMTEEAAGNFRNLYQKNIQEVDLMGSLEFLDFFPEFNPVTLDEMWQKSAWKKLGGGTYVTCLSVDGKEIYLINGFHPRQLIHFTQEGRSIVAFTLTGDLDWSTARSVFIGKTNPSEAKSGSLRNELLVNQLAYGLSTVSSSQNGFHLSAGPVEGLVELIRYGSDYSTGEVKTVEDFSFGRQLSHTFNTEKIKDICSNVQVAFQGKKAYVFDLTEEKNSEEALKILTDSVF